MSPRKTTPKATSPARTTPKPAKKPAAGSPRAPRAKPPEAEATSDSVGVDRLLDGLDHPHRATIDALRRAILGTDSSIAEGIKWNAPSFRCGEWFATIHLRAKAGVQLILHLGAKARSGVDLASVPDPDGLLTRLASDRCTVSFATPADVSAKAKALAAVIKSWQGLFSK